MGVKSVIMGATSPSALGAEGALQDAELKEITVMPSTLETIDRALFEWLSEELDIFATTNKGWNKVPVIWAGSERSHQIKKDKELLWILIFQSILTKEQHQG